MAAADIGGLSPARWAEYAAIGCLLAPGAQVGEALEILEAGMFDDAGARAIFGAVRQLHDRGGAIDVVTAMQIAGSQYRVLAVQCHEIAPHHSRAAEYAMIVRENWRKRATQAGLSEICSLCDAPGSVMREVLDRLGALLEAQRRIEDGIRDSSAREMKSAFAEWTQALREPSQAILTGYGRFDKLTGGFQRGGLYVISGRPGCGKSDFGLALALKMTQFCRVLYCTMEMPRTQCTDRIVASLTRINAAFIRDRRLSGENHAAIAKATELMGDAPLVLDEQTAITAADVKAKVLKHRCGVVFIDNLQLMRFADKKNLWEAYSDTTKALKQLALGQGIVIVLLAQEKREADRGGKPTLSGLSGSSAIEQDADGVFFIRNEETTRVLQGDDWIETKVYVKKNRHGMQNVTAAFRWQPHYHHYTPMEGGRHGWQQAPARPDDPF